MGHPRKIWSSLSILAVVLSIHAGAHAARWRLNLTESLPRGLYRLVSEPLRRGSLVVYCPDDRASRLARDRGFLGAGSCPSGVRPVLKVAAAVAGDVVVFGPEGARVHGCLLPSSVPRTRDRAGRPLASARFGHYELARGEVWLHGPEPSSWDSRYLGPVSLAGASYSTARPVVTLGGWIAAGE